MNSIYGCSTTTEARERDRLLQSILAAFRVQREGLVESGGGSALKASAGAAQTASLSLEYAGHTEEATPAALSHHAMACYQRPSPSGICRYGRYAIHLFVSADLSKRFM